jgi:hypothetical protein
VDADDGLISIHRGCLVAMRSDDGSKWCIECDAVVAHVAFTYPEITDDATGISLSASIEENIARCSDAFEAELRRVRDIPNDGAVDVDQLVSNLSVYARAWAAEFYHLGRVAASLHTGD